MMIAAQSAKCPRAYTTTLVPLALFGGIGADWRVFVLICWFLTIYGMTGMTLSGRMTVVWSGLLFDRAPACSGSGVGSNWTWAQAMFSHHRLQPRSMKGIVKHKLPLMRQLFGNQLRTLVVSDPLSYTGSPLVLTLRPYHSWFSTKSGLRAQWSLKRSVRWARRWQKSVRY